MKRYKLMNILYCGDENVSAGLTLSVLSLINHHTEPLHVYVLTMELPLNGKTYHQVSPETTEVLERELKKNNPQSSLHVLDVAELFRRELPESNLGTRFTPYCMLRLFADRLDEIPDKILYLDTDVLCRGNLEEFYGTDLEGHEFAGVLDYYGSWFFRRKWWRRDYCNSGVLLLNMKEIRRTGLFTACRRMIMTQKLFFPDQTALNRLTVSRILADRRYNEQRKLQPDTVLQHFATSFRLFPVIHTLSVKPWQFDRVHEKLKLYEYDDLFAQYERLSAGTQ